MTKDWDNPRPPEQIASLDDVRKPEEPAEQKANETFHRNSAQAMLDAQVRQVLGVTIRGLMVSSPNVPPIELLKSICRETGNLVSGAVTGDIAAVTGMREDFRRGFSEGVKKAPLLQAAPMPTPRQANMNVRG